MAIYDFETDKEITGVLTQGSRKKLYDRIINSLDANELTSIRNKLDNKISGKEIITSGWLPGNNWNGTPYQPIYDKAACGDYEISGLMFGIMVWEAFERHPDKWFTGRFEIKNRDIGSRTYFKPGH